jgi:dTDP-4-dehydrorhamnose 3,5-epimerase
MKVSKTILAGVLMIEPRSYQDARGFFMETYQQQKYADAGIACKFIQDNLAYSMQNTLRGLHFQQPQAQAKLIQVIQGVIVDVTVDIRTGSPTFGQWDAVELSDVNRRQLFVPEGFAHGFCVLSETAYVHYKCSDVYAPQAEGGVYYADPDLGIQWPVAEPLLSDKDSRFPFLRDIPLEKLPTYQK